MRESKFKEDNALIAIFRGYELITPEMRRHPETWTHSYWQKDYPDKQTVLGEENGLEYHCSWNKLIPVCSQISTTEEFQYKYPGQSVFWDIFTMMNISEVYREVINFIKWYNNEQTRNT